MFGNFVVLLYDPEINLILKLQLFCQAVKFETLKQRSFLKRTPEKVRESMRKLI